MNAGIDLPRDVRGNVSNSNLHIDRARNVIKTLKIVLTQDEHKSLLNSIASVSRPTVVSFVNAHALNMAWKCPAFAASLCRSDVLLRDGIGVCMLMDTLGISSGLNMNGTDFIPQIVPYFAGKRVAICGTKEPYLSKAVNKVREMGGNVVLVMDGFGPHEAYVEQIEACMPELVILGMGMPKQESISMLLKERLRHGIVIVNGGAILDFWAGRFPRAPQIWQKMKLEWLFRLLLEPGRLWKRYLLGGAAFATHAFQLRMYGIFK